MSHARIHRRILAPLVALMLVVGVRSAGAMYRCAGDGVARTACCCPQDETAKPEREDFGPALEAPCCCDVELAFAIAAVDVRVAPDGASSHEVAAVRVIAIDGAVATIRRSQVSAGPPYVHRTSGPPLRLVKQSFLI